jgi:hypothetical protein
LGGTHFGRGLGEGHFGGEHFGRMGFGRYRYGYGVPYGYYGNY